MMRCGSRIIRDKVGRKGREKDRRGIINEATGPQQAAVGDYDERDEIVRSRIGCDPQAYVSPVLLESKSGTISLVFEAGA